MVRNLRSKQGSTTYAQRKPIVEPVNGQIMEARGLRRFLLRGIEKVEGQWHLIVATQPAQVVPLPEIACAGDGSSGGQRMKGDDPVGSSQGSAMTFIATPNCEGSGMGPSGRCCSATQEARLGSNGNKLLAMCV